jgi:hypothetical protein
MKSLEDLVSHYGRTSFRDWLASSQYYQHNLKVYIDTTVNKVNLKACLLDFENDSHLVHNKFNGLPSTYTPPSSTNEQYKRILIDEFFWNSLLNFLADKRLSFPVSYLFREEVCDEDGAKLNQSTFEHSVLLY